MERIYDPSLNDITDTCLPHKAFEPQLEKKCFFCNQCIKDNDAIVLYPIHKTCKKFRNILTLRNI
jgi:hypothetical protein